MPDQALNLIKGDIIGNETDYRDALPVNMYAIYRPMFGVQGYMLQYPGLTKLGEGFGIDRGGVWNERQENHFRVSGSDFIEVDKNGNSTSLGIIGGSDTASFAYSFNTQAIVANENYYLYDPVNGFRQILDPDVGNPIDIVWIDGYYCFTDGENLYHTDITDEESIDPLNYGTAEFMPDPALGVAKTQDNKWMVFGRYTVEYFRNDASADFSFSRVQQRAIKIGIVGTHCKAELGGNWFILGGRKEEAVSVHVLGVGSAQKVATREVEKVIGIYSEEQLRDSVVESYEEDGYSFVIIHLPNHTLLFNQTISVSAGIDNAWTILKTDVKGNATYRAIHGVFDARRGEWIYGDKRNANIGILDSKVATHYDDIAEWLLFSPLYYFDSQSIDQIEIETIPGHTTSDESIVDLSMTYDAVFYGTAYGEEYGMQNDYNKRWYLRRLGYVRDYVGFKLRGASRSRMAFGAGKITYG
ncbi:MAG: hypothetical protein KAJ19_25095 [Gammaproteobacteria bacterium]|nr:hypothetical protein [Gammaproteobacteria bacterium]